jgi:hypothetical protein
MDAWKVSFHLYLTGMVTIKHDGNIENDCTDTIVSTPFCKNRVFLFERTW